MLTYGNINQTIHPLINCQYLYIVDILWLKIDERFSWFFVDPRDVKLLGAEKEETLNSEVR